jgi:hypothetical protein
MQMIKAGNMCLSQLDEEHQYDVVPYEKFEDTKGVIRNRKYVIINKFTHIQILFLT